MNRELRSFFGEIKEFIALWHWFSNLAALLTLISEKGVTAGSILWIISGITSGLLAEVIQTHIPSYLRAFFNYFFDIAH